MSQLIPCPFCGAPAYIDYDVAQGMFGPEAEHEKGCLLQNWDMHDFSDAELLQEVWNTRALTAEKALEAAQAKVGRYEAALKQCAEAPHSGWTIAQAIARKALAEGGGS